MKDWLEKQKAQEPEVLDSVGLQARQIAEDLIPQIRLCALENENVSDILIKVHFEFDDDKTEIWSEGAVDFPPKQSTSELHEVVHHVENS